MICANAIEFGNAGIGQIRILIGQKASQLGSLGRDAPMDGQSKSSLMSSLIDVVEAKRRCITVAASRYGLRGVRVGETSHPGPPRTCARVRMEAEVEAEVAR